MVCFFGNIYTDVRIKALDCKHVRALCFTWLDFALIVYYQPRNQYRTSITIPERSWGRFRDVFSDYVDKMKELRAAPVEEEEDQDHEQGDGDANGNGEEE